MWLKLNKMKDFKIVFSTLFLFIITIFSAQIKNPVKFKFDVNPVGKDEYEAVLTATIEDKWHIYSQDLPPDSGIPTEFKITSKQGIQLIGKVQEIGKKHDEFSEAFGAQIVYYSNKVVFKQKFKPKDASKPATITAEIMYQTCNDRVCLAPNTLEFEKQIKGSKTAVAQEEKVEKTKDTIYEVAPMGKVGTVLKPTNIEAQAPTVAKQEGLKIISLDFKSNKQKMEYTCVNPNMQKIWLRNLDWITQRILTLQWVQVTKDLE